MFSNVMYSCNQSWIYSIITPDFSVTLSFRNQSNNDDLLLKKHFSLLSALKTFLLLIIFKRNKLNRTEFVRNRNLLLHIMFTLLVFGEMNGKCDKN